MSIVQVRGSSVLEAGEGMLYGDLTKREQEVLFRYCQTPGPHIDIGTANGGSAHTAARAKNGTGHVYSIDAAPTGKAEMALDAFMAGWRDRITLIEEKSQIWDPPENPTTVFIDGDHELKGCLTDWVKYSAITSCFVLFHDTDHDDIKLVLAGVNSDPRWQLVESVDKIAVYERVDNADE